MSQFIFTDQFPGVSTGATIPSATTLHSHVELRLQFFKEEELLLILTKTIVKPKAYMWILRMTITINCTKNKYQYFQN